MSEKPPARVSFSKEKIGNFPTGRSGITGTSDSSRNPMSEPTATFQEGNASFNSSDLLFRNIDKLGQELNQEHVEDCVGDNETLLEEIMWEDDLLEDMTEDEVIMNLDQHLYNDNKREVRRISLNTTNIVGPAMDYVVAKPQSITTNFCTQCGRGYSPSDNFCGGCGNKRI